MQTKSLLFAMALAILTSCDSGKKEEAKVLSANTTETADAKTLMLSFNNAWNKKDSAAVMDMLADNALLISGRIKYSGKKEIADKWIHRNMPGTSNLKIEDLQTNAAGNVAYSAGTWSLEITPPGKPVTIHSGNHTFVWKKESEGSWKLILLNMEDHDPEASK